METLGTLSDVITKMSNMYLVMSFYDYAYESVKVIRCLWQKTRNLWINQQDVLARIFIKQTIYLKISWEEASIFDERTIKVLKKGSKYKLFKFSFRIFYDQSRIKLFYRMLDELPGLLIDQIYLFTSENEIIHTLMKKSNFQTKQDLYRVI